jgi:hypothetical protein
MPHRELPGRLGSVAMNHELPQRNDLGLIFDELDYQMATQAYLWALPLVCAVRPHVRAARSVGPRPMPSAPSGGDSPLAIRSFATATLLLGRTPGRGALRGVK